MTAVCAWRLMQHRDCRPATAQLQLCWVNEQDLPHLHEETLFFMQQGVESQQNGMYVHTCAATSP